MKLITDRDGTMDIIFPTCSRQSSTTGLGHDCSINIAYNRQIPTCSSEGSKFNADGKITCRGHGDMCQSDPEYSFDFTDSEVSCTHPDFVIVHLLTSSPLSQYPSRRFFLHRVIRNSSFMSQANLISHCPSVQAIST